MRLKRLIAFFFLVVAGVLVLWLAGGDDPAFVANAGTSGDGRAGAESRSADQKIRGTASGVFTWAMRDDVQGPDGKQFKLARFDLQSPDMRPLGEDRMELRDATVVFHDWSFTPQGEPRIRDRARLHADRILIGRDRKSGLPEPRGKETPIDGVRLELFPDGLLRRVLLVTNRMIVTLGDDLLVARTDGTWDPFTATLEGSDGNHVLSGEGLTIESPGRSKGPPTRGALLRVHRNADLRSVPDARPGVTPPRTIVARCRGPLEYRTLPDDPQVGTVSLRDGVEFTFTETVAGVERRGGFTAEAGTFNVVRDGERAAWPVSGDLHGTPVVIDWNGARLRGREANFVCPPHGSPSRILVTGDPSLVAPKTLLRGEQDLDIAASESIELCDIRSLAGPALTAFGFPDSAVPAVHRWLFLRGHCVAKGAVAIDAQRGLVLAAGEESGDAMWIRGFGEVTVEPEAGVRLTGNDGFVLQRSASGPLALTLGPDIPSLAHTYDLALRETTILGRGSFKLREDETGLRSIDLFDPGQTGSIELDITVTAPAADKPRSAAASRAGRPNKPPAPTVSLGRRVRLTHARSLHATFDDKDPRTLNLEGSPIVLEDQAQGSKVTGTTLDLRPDGALLVRGVPAVLTGRTPGEGDAGRPFGVEAAEFEFWQGESPVLVARHGVVFTMDRYQAGNRAYKCKLKCVTLTAFQHLVPEAIADLALLPVGDRLEAITRQRWSGDAGWFRAVGDVDMVLDDERGGSQTMVGRLLFMRADGTHGALLGPEALLTIRRPDRSSLACRAESIVKDGDHIQVGAAGGRAGAVLRLHGKGQLLPGRGDEGGGDTEVVCTRPIHITPEHIVTDGPTTLTALDENGRSAPDSLRMDAASVEADCDPEKDGMVTQLRARGPIVLRRGTLVARCDDLLSLDPETGWMRVRSRRDLATVEMGSAMLIEALDFEFNLKTYESRLFRGALRTQGTTRE